MDKQRVKKLKSRDFVVKTNDARVNARFHTFSMTAAKFRGFAGWDKARLVKTPTVIYDLSGVPLFYDFTVYRGKTTLGVVRTSANKILGDPIVSTQVNPVGWSKSVADKKFSELLKKKYPRHSTGRPKIVCYSYPKLALHVEAKAPNGKVENVMMDVGDFTEIEYKLGSPREFLGQVPYSLLDMIKVDQEKKAKENYEKISSKVESTLTEKKDLDEKRFFKLAPSARLAALEKVFFKDLTLFQMYTQRILDFCCHTSECQDHECFCLHPQENNVHCARASGQMMLCYWRYCFSQHEIAEAYGVADTALTPVAAVVPGLESLTNNCFDATLQWTVDWTTHENEIKQRRPIMNCIPGHARACAGTKQWNIWIIGTPRPRYLYIFDPWPPTTGAIYWENFNTTTYLCLFTLKRKTTNHP